MMVLNLRRIGRAAIMILLASKMKKTVCCVVVLFFGAIAVGSVHFDSAPDAGILYWIAAAGQTYSAIRMDALANKSDISLIRGIK